MQIGNRHRYLRHALRAEFPHAPRREPLRCRVSERARERGRCAGAHGACGSEHYAGAPPARRRFARRRARYARDDVFHRAAGTPTPTTASAKNQGRGAQLSLHNHDDQIEDKGEDSACPRAGARRMPEIFMLALGTAAAKCPVGYVRVRRPANVVDFGRIVVVTATIRMRQRLLPQRPGPACQVPRLRRSRRPPCLPSSAECRRRRS